MAIDIATKTKDKRPCLICGKDIRDEMKTQRNHLKRMHFPSLQCQGCGLRFGKFHELKRHGENSCKGNPEPHEQQLKNINADRFNIDMSEKIDESKSMKQIEDVLLNAGMIEDVLLNAGMIDGKLQQQLKATTDHSSTASKINKSKINKYNINKYKINKSKINRSKRMEQTKDVFLGAGVGLHGYEQQRDDKVMNDATSEDVDGEYESDDTEMHNETAGDSVGSTPPELGLSPNREPDPSLVSAVAGLQFENYEPYEEFSSPLSPWLGPLHLGPSPSWEQEIANYYYWVPKITDHWHPRETHSN